MELNESTLNIIPCGILVISRTGTIFYFNEYMKNIFSSESEIINFSKTQILDVINSRSDLFIESTYSDSLFVNYVNTKKHVHYSVKRIKDSKNELFLFIFTDITTLKNHINKLNDFFYSALINLKSPVINSFNEVEMLISRCMEKKCLEDSKAETIRENARNIINKIEELKINYIKNFHFAGNHKKVNVKELIVNIINGLRTIQQSKISNYEINSSENDIHEIVVDPDSLKKTIVYIFEQTAREMNINLKDFSVDIKNKNERLNIKFIFRNSTFPVSGFDTSEIDRMVLRAGGLFNTGIENSGVVFNLSFPLFEEAPKDGKHKMAIVEDDIDILELYKAIFSDNSDLNIEYFDSAKVFLDKKRDFELLIVDLYMPEVSGFDLISNYTKENKDCKIIIVSGAPPQSINRKSNEQIVDVLSKPIDIFTLMSSVKKAIDMVDVAEEE